MSGAIVSSLDFELLWRGRDHATCDSYDANVPCGREAIPRSLDRFERHRISATRATVGLLMAESRDELPASLPPEDLRPRHAGPRLSNDRYLDEVGEDGRRDWRTPVPAFAAQRHFSAVQAPDRAARRMSGQAGSFGRRLGRCGSCIGCMSAG